LKIKLAIIGVLMLSGCSQNTTQAALDKCRQTPGCVNTRAASEYGPAQARAIDPGLKDQPQN
jgi:uncharacterized protein (DUF1499 family)